MSTTFGRSATSLLTSKNRDPADDLPGVLSYRDHKLLRPKTHRPLARRGDEVFPLINSKRLHKTLEKSVSRTRYTTLNRPSGVGLVLSSSSLSISSKASVTGTSHGIVDLCDI